ncbi:MAG: class IV adenylate cyclase, partial [Ignisphaera sp.]
DSALRLRVSRDIQTGNTRCELTFKGPREKHDFAKIRKELTVGITDVETMLDILKMLGFKVLAVIYKKRKIYQDGIYHIYLDEVEGLGKFIELEYVSEYEYNELLIGDEVLKLVDKLSIKRNFITKSYLELILSRTGSTSL